MVNGVVSKVASISTTLSNESDCYVHKPVSNHRGGQYKSRSSIPKPLLVLARERATQTNGPLTLRADANHAGTRELSTVQASSHQAARHA